ncbi:MAG: protein kinase [Ignavibacteriae bacterium]|nr:protein kinase [Ignavibacteriota bacterium]
MESINNYNIIEKIGEGGMSKVYLAEHKYLHKLNALKKLKLQDKTIIEKFIKEAQILYGLNHNYIVKVEDCFDYENNLYIVIEYVKGLSLDKYIKKDGRIEQRKALEIFKKILCGVEYAHSSNIIHRDIKPSNIMIDENVNPKILDFGIAKIINTGLTTSSTTTLMNIGSPAYMSPEQYKSETADLRTDIYSLGIVFYEMLTGVNPYLLEDATPVSLGYKIVHEPLPDPKTYFPEINKHFREIILKCTQKNPYDRYNNCKEIIEALDKILSGSIKVDKIQNAPNIPNKKTGFRLKKNKAVSILIILVILISVSILGKYIFFDKTFYNETISNNKNDTTNSVTVVDQWKYKPSSSYFDFHKIQFINNTGWMISWSNENKGLSYIYKTNNECTSKDEIYKSNPSNRIKDIFFVDDKIGWMLVGSNYEYWKSQHFKLFKTTNGGEKWINQLNTTQLFVGHYDEYDWNSLTCLYFINSNIGFVGSDGCIYKTMNGGYKWSKTVINNVLGVKNYITGLFFVDSDNGWGSCNDGVFVKTTNGGESWQTIFTKYKKSFHCKTFFINTTTGWAVGNGGSIVKTTDGGINWNKQHSDAQNNLRDILFVNENTGWIVGGMGTLLKTTNAGEKWEYVTIPNRNFLNSIAKSNDNKLYIACDKGGILTLDLEKH